MLRIRKDKGRENGLASHGFLGAVHNSSKCLPRMVSIHGEINDDAKGMKLLYVVSLMNSENLSTKKLR